MAYILIIAGLLSFIWGVVILTHKEKSAVSTQQLQNVIPDTNNLVSSAPAKGTSAKHGKLGSSESRASTAAADRKTKAAADKAPENSANPTEPSDRAIESKEKGDAFEKYVVKRFSRKHFKIKEWRGDKYVDGVYAESNRYPDLEIGFTLRDKQDVFAVECKWRKSSFNGELRWGENYQLEQYQKFSEHKNLPVFIIIGVGGSPSDPKYLYVIPLQDVKSHILNTSDIKRFLKTDDRDFYWSLEERTLS